MNPKQYVDGSYSDPDRKHEIIDLAPGLKVMVPFCFVTEDEAGYDVKLVLDVDEDDRLMTSSIVVKARPGGSPVDGSALRKIRVAELYQQAVGNALNLKTAGDDPTTMKLDPVAGLAVELRSAISGANPGAVSQRGGLTEAALQAVATLYEAASASGLPPQKYVMAALEVPRSTAGYWIAQARKRGHLPPSSRSKARD